MGYEDHIQQAQSVTGKFAVLTLSDTRTPETDTSGQTIRRLLTEAGHTVSYYKVLPDYPSEQLAATLENCLTNNDVHSMITNGGTGIYKRDLTIPEIEKILDIPLPGFGELFRMLSFQQIGAGAILSRATGGIARRKPVFALPGSTQAVELGMTQIILPQIKHMLMELRKK